MAGRNARRALGVAIVAACAERPRSEREIHLVIRHARMPGSADPLPALRREFAALHPGVRVERESLPWTADIQHQFYVINLEARASGFDVLMLDVI